MEIDLAGSMNDLSVQMEYNLMDHLLLERHLRETHLVTFQLHNNRSWNFQGKGKIYIA